MYSTVDGYTCTATAVAAASRRQRPQCSMAAATAGPMFRKVNCWQQVRCGTVATAAVSMLIGKVDWWQQVRCGTVAAAAAGPSVFEQGTTEESLHNVQ